MQLYALTRYALLHDQYEAFSGDMAAMVKDLIDEKALEERYKSYVAEQVTVPQVAKDIVKTADIFEALVFLNTEMALGNCAITDCIQYLEGKLESHMIEVGVGVYYGRLIGVTHRFRTHPIKHMDLRDAA